MKTALVIGTTGLVGRRLVEQLLNDQAFEKLLFLPAVRADFNLQSFRSILSTSTTRSCGSTWLKEMCCFRHWVPL